MATTIEPRAGTQPYVDADEYIDFQLAKTQSQIKTTEILTSASWLALAALAYVLTFVVLDQWVMPGGFGALTRGLWLGFLLIGGGGWLTWRVLIPCFRTVHELYAAKMIESADVTLKSSLLNLIDLQLHGRKSQSSLVRTSMEKRAAVELSKVDVDHAIDRHTLLRVAYSLLGMVVVCSLYVMLSPKDAFSSVQRLLLPTSQTAVATRTAITNVTPEDTKVLAGELLTVEADILGQAPPQVTLIYTTADREFVDQPVDMQRLEDGGTSRWRGVISGEKGRGLMQDIAYHIEAGDARTRDYQIQVLEPPSSKVETISYTFPAYMKLDPKVHSGGHIDAWEGTKVVVNATTNLPVQSALLVMTDTDNPLAKGEEIRMTIREGRQLTAEWTLDFRTDGTFARYYHIECTTPAGESDPQPTVFAIKIQPDQRPDVALLHPTQDLERPANAVIPLLVKASDPDFQLRFVTLKIEKAGEEFPSVSLLDEERPIFEGTHDLQLEKLSAAGLKPGDEILYWIEARDNKQPHGNRTATPRLKIKITAPAKADEIAQQLEEDRQRQQEQAESDNNPTGQEKPQPEQAAEKDPKKVKPPENKPERKPGDPQPREADHPPDEPKENGEEPQNKPQRDPNKPDAEQQQKPQPGKNPSGKPQPNKNQPGQPQPNEPKPGEKNPDDAAQTGEQKGGDQTGQKGTAGDKSKPGKQGTKPGDASKQPGQGDPSNTAERKTGPADDQTALQKFIERQQQNPEPDSDKPENEPKPGNEPQSGKPKAGDKPDSKPTGKPKSEQRPNGDNPQTPPEGETKQPGENDPAKPPKTGNKSPQQKPGEPGKPGEKPPMPGENPMPGEKPMPGETKPQQPGNDNTGKPQPNGQKPNGTKPEGTKPGEKPMPGSPPGQPEAKPGEPQPNGDKPLEKGPDGEAKGPMTDKATGPKPENKPGQNQPANKTPPKSPNAQGGAENGGEKSPGPKTKGPASTPTQEKDPNNTDAPEPGQGNGQKPNTPKKAGTEPKQPGPESPDNVTGEEKPAEEGPNATKKKATGKETGPAVGQEKPEGEAPRAENDLERKPESKPGAMRKGEKPEPGSKAPKATKTKPDGSKNPEQPMPGTGKAADHPAEKRPGDAPSQDEPNPGPGQPNQKTQKPDSGEAGGGTPQNQGTPGSKQEGTGDTQKKPGDKTPDKTAQGGKPGEKPGPGSTTKPTEEGTGGKKSGEKNATGGEPSTEKPNGEPGSEPTPNEAGKPEEGRQPKPGDNSNPKPDAGKPGAGKPDTGKPGEGGEKGTPGKSPGPQGGKPGQGGQPAAPGTGSDNSDQPGNEAGNGPGQPNGERRNLAPAEQDQAEQEAAEKANEEFARKASNLVLKKLRKDIDRGEVDQQLLDELGWNKEDMERFVKRLEQQLDDPGSDNSPESVANRKQFEETLKSLGLSSKTKKRTAKSGTTTRTGEVGARKIAPPPEYQELFEEYTKELSKPTTPNNKK